MQAVFDFWAFDLHTTCTSVHYKFSPLLCLLYAEFGLAYTADKHFELLHSGTVKLSPQPYFVSTKCQKGQSQWPHVLKHGPEAAGSNSTRGMDVCLLWTLCVVRHRFLWWVDHSSRGVLLSVLCLRVGLHKATLHTTQQWVQMPAHEWAASKLATPITLRNEKARQ